MLYDNHTPIQPSKGTHHKVKHTNGGKGKGWGIIKTFKTGHAGRNELIFT